jgi:hypothetical protein
LSTASSTAAIGPHGTWKTHYCCKCETVSRSRVVGASSLPLQQRIARNFSAELEISKLPRWWMVQKPLPQIFSAPWIAKRLTDGQSTTGLVIHRRVRDVVRCVAASMFRGGWRRQKKGTLMECCFRLLVAWLDSRVPVMNFGTSGLWGFR